MFFFALLPLGFYFLLLAIFHVRSRSIVLTGVQDLMLLACGLSGLFIAGPGRLIVPVFVWNYWDFAAWIFLIVFYFTTAYLLAVRTFPRLVIYHGDNVLSVRKLIQFGKDFDPRSTHLGNVLSMPELGIQFSIQIFNLGGTVQFQATGPYQNEKNWERFRQALSLSFLSESASPKSLRPFFCMLCFAVLIFAGAGTALWLEGSEIVRSLQEYTLFDAFQ